MVLKSSGNYFWSKIFNAICFCFEVNPGPTTTPRKCSATYHLPRWGWVLVALFRWSLSEMWYVALHKTFHVYSNINPCNKSVYGHTNFILLNCHLHENNLWLLFAKLSRQLSDNMPLLYIYKDIHIILYI